MSALGNAAGRVVGEIRHARTRLAVQPANDAVVPLPVLPTDLQLQVDRLIGQRFGKFVMTMPDGAVFHPDAARLADQQRAAIAPASEAAIRKWFMVIVNSLAPGPVGPDAVFGALLLTCGDFPAPCFERSTAAAIVGKQEFLPLAKVMKEVLQPIADRLRGTLHALDLIAQAKPETMGTVHFGPAREATEPYNPVANPPPEPRRRPLRERGDDDFDLDEAKAIDAEARKSGAAQLTALKLTQEASAAALKALNEARGNK